MLSSRRLLRPNALPVSLGRPRATGWSPPPPLLRQFSSVRPACLTAPRPPLASLRRVTPLVSLASVRFNSTAPKVPSGPDAAPPISPDPLDLNLSDAVGPASQVDPSSLGYLNSLGLDHGFGPTSLIQTLLESMHVFSGMPWWASITVSVVVVRTLLFPFYCRMSDTAARMKELAPLITPFNDRMREASARNDRMEMMLVRQEMQQMFKTAGINRLWLLFPIAQIPIFVGFYRSLFKMANLPVPELTTGGLSWFEDLTEADPLMALPMASSALIAVQFLMGGEAGTNRLAGSIKRVLLFVVPAVSFFVTMGWPTAICWYLFCNALFSVTQSGLLRQAWFRRKLGLYPLTPNVKNPLSAENTLSSLNVAPGAAPNAAAAAAAAAAATAPSTKQIGAKGGFLDRLTGGADEAGSEWSIQSWKEKSAQKAKERKHKQYEENWKKRVEKEKREQQLRRSRNKRMQDGE